MKIRNLLGFAMLFPWQWGKQGFVPGTWTPRFDEHGRIYMLIGPYDGPTVIGKTARDAAADDGKKEE